MKFQHSLFLFVVLIWTLCATDASELNKDFFSIIPNHELEITGQERIEPTVFSKLNFREINHDYLKNPTVKKDGLVYQSEPIFCGETISLFLKSSEFLKQFQLELRDLNYPSTKTQLIIRSSPVIKKWDILTWILPPALKSQSLTLIITNTSPIHELSQFSFSDPFSGKISSEGLHLGQLTFTVFLTCLALILLFFPGTILTFYLETKLPVYSLMRFPLLLISTCVLAYMVFWIYHFQANLGFCTVIVLYCGSILRIGNSSTSCNTIDKYFKDSDLRNSISLLISAIFISIISGFLYNGWEIPTDTAQARYLHASFPHDNILPYLFSERLFLNQPISPFFNDWLSSDRPPLQTALVLLTRIFAFDPELQYQLTSVILQCWLIPCIYILLRAINITRHISYVISLSMIFTASFILNSFYTWPKLLPASFMMLNFALLFFPQRLIRSQNQLTRSLLLGVTTTLPILAHGGSIFGIAPMYLVALFLGKLPSFRYWGWITLPFVIGMAPWIFYQKIIDPPGNHLLLWHLAGYHGDSETGFFRLLFSQYQNLGFDAWLSNKTENLKVLKGNWRMSFMHIYPLQVLNNFELLRSGMFANLLISIFPQLGLLLLAPYALIQRGHRLSKKLPSMFLVLLSGLLLWVLMMFDPGRTILHQGSYFLPFLFSLILLLIAYETSPKLMGIFCILNLLLISIIWVIPLPITQVSDHWVINKNNANPLCISLYMIFSFYISLKTLRNSFSESST